MAGLLILFDVLMPASLGLGPNFRHRDDERPGTLNRRVHPYATEQV
jgi:hypothetical protein